MSDIIYMSLRGLMAYVDRRDNPHTRTKATQLWNLVTANLPQEKAVFDVLIDKTGERLELKDYKAWRKAVGRRISTSSNARIRSKWILAPALVKRFQEIVDADPKAVNGYGPLASELLKDWFDSRPR